MGLSTELVLKIAAGFLQGEQSTREQKKALRMETIDILGSHLGSDIQSHHQFKLQNHHLISSMCEETPWVGLLAYSFDLPADPHN